VRELAVGSEDALVLLEEVEIAQLTLGLPGFRQLRNVELL
jgi:hypothetical protein